MRSKNGLRTWFYWVTNWCSRVCEKDMICELTFLTKIESVQMLCADSPSVLANLDMKMRLCCLAEVMLNATCVISSQSSTKVTSNRHNQEFINAGCSMWGEDRLDRHQYQRESKEFFLLSCVYVGIVRVCLFCVSVSL